MLILLYSLRSNLVPGWQRSHKVASQVSLCFTELAESDSWREQLEHILDATTAEGKGQENLDKLMQHYKMYKNNFVRDLIFDSNNIYFSMYYIKNQ